MASAPAEDKWAPSGAAHGGAAPGGGVGSDPATGGGGGGGRRESTFATMVGKAKVAPAQTVNFFKEKPKQSTACVLIIFTTCMLLLCMMIPWFNYWGKDSDYSGHVTLFRNTACSKIGSRKDKVSSHSCTLTELVYIAKDLDYFRQAGGVGFAFLLLAWAVCLLASYTTYKHRMNRSDDISQKLGPLRTYKASAIMHFVASGLVFFSWVCYVGVVNTGNSDSHLTLLNSGKEVKRHLFGPGVAFMILAQFFLPACGVLWWMFEKESGKSAGGTAEGTGESGGNATVPTGGEYPSAYGGNASAGGTSTTNPVGPAYGGDAAYPGYGTPAPAPAYGTAPATAPGYGGDAGYPAPAAGGSAADDAYAEAQRRAAAATSGV